MANDEAICRFVDELLKSALGQMHPVARAEDAGITLPAEDAELARLLVQQGTRRHGQLLVGLYFHAIAFSNFAFRHQATIYRVGTLSQGFPLGE